MTPVFPSDRLAVSLVEEDEESRKKGEEGAIFSYRLVTGGRGSRRSLVGKKKDNLFPIILLFRCIQLLPPSIPPNPLIRSMFLGKH